MIAYVLTLLFLLLSLVSPAVLPDSFQDIHILQILAVLIVLFSIPNIAESGVFRQLNTYLVVGLFLAAVMSTVATGWLGGALNTFSSFVPSIGAFFFTAINCTTLRRLKILSYVLLAGLIYILVHGWIAVHAGYVESPYFMTEGHAETLIYRYRGLGAVNDPNDLGQVIVTTIPLLVLSWKKRASIRNLLVVVLPCAALIFGLYLTHSRGGLIALVAVALYGLKDRLGVVRSTILTGLLCVALVAFNASGGRNVGDDDGGRLSLWGEALSTFRTHPVFGVGAHNFGDYSDNGLTAHNSYVLCLAEMGAIGYFFWIGILVTSWSGATGASPEVSRETNLQLRQASTNWRRPLPAFAGPALAGNAPALPTWRLPAYGVRLQSKAVPVDSSLASIAHIVKTALLGTMISAFFISRTYAMIFCIMFGICSVLKNLRGDIAEEQQRTKWYLQRTVMVMFGSIALLYIMLRVRGLH